MRELYKRWAEAAASREQYWQDRRGTGDALVNLLDIVLHENAPALKQEQGAREALLALASYPWQGRFLRHSRSRSASSA